MQTQRVATELPGRPTLTMDGASAWETGPRPRSTARTLLHGTSPQVALLDVSTTRSGDYLVLLGVGGKASVTVRLRRRALMSTLRGRLSRTTLLTFVQLAVERARASR